MSVEIRTNGETVTAYLSGELDHHSAKEMRQAVDDAVELNMPSKLVLDFKGVSFMDSSGIGVIIGRAKKLKYFNDSSVAVRNTSDRVNMILKCAGIYRIVTKQ